MFQSEKKYLAQHAKVWAQKRSLRLIYSDYYQRILKRLIPGLTLEVGAGIGQFKKAFPQCISLDLFPFHSPDLIADAHRLPFKTSALHNIVAIDVFHHLERPTYFLKEAARLLPAGGRLILLEPGISPISSLFFRLFHSEPFDLAVDPLTPGPLTPDRSPFEANQAFATTLIRQKKNLLQNPPYRLCLIQKDWISLLAYPLTGGFKRWCLIPPAVIKPLLIIENFIARFVGHIFGFRLLIVFEKIG